MGRYLKLVRVLETLLKLGLVPDRSQMVHNLLVLGQEVRLVFYHQRDYQGSLGYQHVMRGIYVT